jgi:hypothetical protein
MSTKYALARIKCTQFPLLAAWKIIAVLVITAVVVPFHVVRV